MKHFRKMAAQGDLLITRVDEIPEGLNSAKVENGEYVLAHSETGHSHVIEATRATLYESADDEFIAWLHVEIGAPVTHKREFDTHEPIMLPAGNYEIRRQREYVPEGYRRAAD